MRYYKKGDFPAISAFMSSPILKSEKFYALDTEPMGVASRSSDAKQVDMNWRHFKRLLYRPAPNKTRLRLPVLAGAPNPSEESDVAGEETQEHFFKDGVVYAFPSCQVGTGMRIRVEHPLPSTPGQPPDASKKPPVSYWRLQWRIRYMNIDKDVIRATGFKAPQEEAASPVSVGSMGG
jgi:hypothetical protein